jgi:hypothetical protein
MRSRASDERGAAVDSTLLLGDLLGEAPRAKWWSLS